MAEPDILATLREWAEDVQLAVGCNNQGYRALASAIGEIERLRAELANRDWQPIETAPHDGSHILGWCPEDEEGACMMFWSRRADWRLSQGSGCLAEPTWWMPLPHGPKR